MSEYQFYEFQSIDRPLTEDEMAYVGSLSSRTDPTPRRAVFTYSYSDFRGDPQAVLAKYYDALLYLANWGSKQLAFRIPRSLLDAEALAPYCLSDLITAEAVGEYLIVNVNFYEDEGMGWIEGEGWLSSLVRLRDDLLHGDFRYLYLAWLKAAAMRAIDQDEWEAYDPDMDKIYDYEIPRNTPEPPVPAGLQNLTKPLDDFIDLFEIDADLVAVAAEASPVKPAPAALDAEAMVARLPEAERIDFLVRLARSEPHVGTELTKRLQAMAHPDDAAEDATAPPRRTIGVLLNAAADYARRREEAQRRKAEKARIRKLEKMVPAVPQLWDDVFALIEEKKARPYDQAVALLVDLRDVAEHAGRLDDFYERLHALREQYSNRWALMKRLDEVGLGN